MKNLLHSLGRRQRADKKEECLPRGSAGEKEEQVFSFFLCDVKMVGEEIIKRARREGGRRGEGKKKQQKENKLERREDQCIYTIHL